MKDQLTADMKDAMRAKDKERLGTIRMALAAVKQIEVDERRDVTDADVTAILNKMIKQRIDAAQQFQDANREDLASKERTEIIVLQEYLPEQLSSAAVDSLVASCIADSQAESPRDMGKVMALLKERGEGRLDMKAASAKVRAALQQ